MHRTLESTDFDSMSCSTRGWNCANVTSNLCSFTEWEKRGDDNQCVHEYGKRGRSFISLLMTAVYFLLNWLVTFHHSNLHFFWMLSLAVSSDVQQVCGLVDLIKMLFVCAFLSLSLQGMDWLQVILESWRLWQYWCCANSSYKSVASRHLPYQQVSSLILNVTLWIISKFSNKYSVSLGLQFEMNTLNVIYLGAYKDLKKL